MSAGGRRVAIVGAGWSGATCARVLSDRGVRVEVFERAQVVGGHSRVEVLDGVVYEPNGPHIFHTSDAEVHEFVRRFGMQRPFAHQVVSEVFLSEDDDVGHYLSWPPQVDELEALPVWPQLERELAALPERPEGEDFAGYVTTLIGPTLYRLFVEGYTRKQWGRDPATLSARFAPRRVELRRDGDRRMFRDRWEYFPVEGVNAIIDAVLATSAVTRGADLGIEDLDDLAAGFDAVVVTAALDQFARAAPALEWRGVDLVSERIPTLGLEDTSTRAYQINRPSSRVAYTRTIETKHATGQRIAATVVSEEYPRSDGRHYPVATIDGANERMNDELARRIRSVSPVPLFFTGRLAQYVYINQDEAIRRAMDRADEVFAFLDG